MDRFDHQNLNTLPCFAETVSTTENLAVEVHRIFASYPHARLVRVHIEETPNNGFDYAGAGTPRDRGQGIDGTNDYRSTASRRMSRCRARSRREMLQREPLSGSG